jgi:hypothetical protein
MEIRQPQPIGYAHLVTPHVLPVLDPTATSVQAAQLANTSQVQTVLTVMPGASNVPDLLPANAHNVTLLMLQPVTSRP